VEVGAHARGGQEEEERRHDRDAHDGPWLDAEQDVGDVTQEIDDEQGNRGSVAPEPATPEPDCGNAALTPPLD
jgi:hypothetical protein